jgi:hypothetical protein
MKHKQVLIRVFLAILCLPLTACLFDVSGTSGVKYPIGGNGIVDLTKVLPTELESLNLGGFNLFQSGNHNVSLECKLGSSFNPIYSPDITTKSIKLVTPSDFWGLVAANCDHQADGNNYVIELALKLGDNYAPIFTKDNYTCVFQAIVMQRKQLLPAIAYCVASDPRGPSTSPYGVNPTVEGINKLKILVSQKYFNSI